MKKLKIAANWKMNKTVAESSAYFQMFTAHHVYAEQIDVIICPPYTSLLTAAVELKGSKIFLGAQNLHWEDKGAFTGEVSAPMLKEIGVEYVIIGHSERRHIMREDNQQICHKLKTALQYGLKPILCVGETEEEREKGAMGEVIDEQILMALNGLEVEQVEELVVAYEPVWAIGTGKAALPEDAEGAAHHIKQVITKRFDASTAAKMCIQYGGSVNQDNISSFVQLPSVSGVLVGGASLDALTFSNLIHASGKAVSA